MVYYPGRAVTPNTISSPTVPSEYICAAFGTHQYALPLPLVTNTQRGSANDKYINKSVLINLIMIVYARLYPHHE